MKMVLRKCDTVRSHLKDSSLSLANKLEPSTFLEIFLEYPDVIGHAYSIFSPDQITTVNAREHTNTINKFFEMRRSVYESKGTFLNCLESLRIIDRMNASARYI